MAKNINALREEFATLHQEASAVVEKAESEKREITAEEKVANDTRFARLDAIKSILDSDKKLAGYAFENDKAQKPVEMPGKDEHEAVIRVGQTYDASKLDRKVFGKAFNRWAVTGDMDRQYATITTATQSGILLPTEVARPITPSYVNTFRDAHAKLGVDVFKTQNTATVNLPVMDASAGGVVTETASSETESPPSLSESITLPVKTYQSGSAWFSNQELLAVDFDLFSATLPQLEFAKELGLESAIVTAMKADSNITQVVTNSSLTGITFGDLASLSEKLPKRYQFLKVIILSQAAHAAFVGLTSTGSGQPIMTLVDPIGTQVNAFQGVPVLRSDYLDGFGASHYIGMVVSLVGFRLRDCEGETVARYTQFPARPSQTGYNLFAYHGYGYAPSAVAWLKTAAS